MATSASTEVSSSVIDERRAQQLMERALAFAERGELPAAVLSCRQAISLAPDSPQSYSILGFLLERAGDAPGAISAYETVIRLAPDSQLERESLGRLRASLTPHRAIRDHAGREQVRPERSVSTNETAHSTPIASATPISPVAANSVTVSPPAAGIPAARAATPSNTNLNAQGAGVVGVPLDLPVLPTPEPSTSLWKKLRRRPTSYFRGMPLAGATALSLLFLLWANNFAASRNVNQVAPAAVGETQIERPPGAPDPFSARPNATNPNAPAPRASTTVAVAPNTATPVASSPLPANPVGNPASPGAPAATAPSAPAAPNSGGPARTAPVDDGETLTTPPASGLPPTPANSSTALRDTGGASPRGGPLGPTGSPARGYDRVAPVGGPASRPENRAAGEERAAGDDARSGRPDAAIARLSSAIDSGGPDVALRFQQRAQLYWQGGDAMRAMSDFQSAISAYNEMISRGDRVTIARSGIAACRRGVQMAQARLSQSTSPQSTMP